MNIFKEGKAQSISDVLQAKDQRVAKQAAIFKKYPQQTLVDVKLNIPGPIKNNRYLTKLFAYGIRELEKSWRQQNYAFKLVLQINNAAGPENFYVLSVAAVKVKQTTVAFENSSALGRLFDADVLIKNKKAALSRRDFNLPARRCFLCNRPAKECARSRRHSVQAMQAFISRIYEQYVA